MSGTVAIVQSNYIPWKGYFDIIAHSDVFILLDNAQYTRRDWRNRNKIKTVGGEIWLSIPVTYKGFPRISEVTVVNHRWIDKHWSNIEHAYSRCPGFPLYGPRVREVYEACMPLGRLSEINRIFIESICAWLGIRTRLVWSTELLTAEEMDSMAPTSRLVELTKAAGGEIYLSGPAARSYLDEREFTAAGLGVEWMDYSGYPCYPQRFGEFVHTVSVVDLLLNTGLDACHYMKFVPKTAVP